MNEQRHRTILAVDDDENILFCIKEYFEDRNYRVLTALEFESALNLLRQSSEGVVLITDLQSRDRIQTGKYLLEAVLLEKLPVKIAILMSGSFDLESGIIFPKILDQFRTRGIPYHELSKPFSSRSLKKLIEDPLLMDLTCSDRESSTFQSQKDLIKRARENIGASESDVTEALKKRGVELPVETYQKYERKLGGDPIPSTMWMHICDIIEIHSETTINMYRAKEHLTRVRSAIKAGTFALPVSTKLNAKLAEPSEEDDECERGSCR